MCEVMSENGCVLPAPASSRGPTDQAAVLVLSSHSSGCRGGSEDRRAQGRATLQARGGHLPAGPEW